MNSKKSQKCVAALSCLGIVILFAILAVVWVQFYQGAFSGSHRKQKERAQFADPINYTVSARIGGANDKPGLKEQREKSYLEHLGFDSNVEYVKPMKISPLPLHNHDIIFNEMYNYSDEPLVVYHTGHFRNNMAEIWDPHPHYEISAFGKKLILELAHDNDFMVPGLHISNVDDNFSHKKPEDTGLHGCYYSGSVKGDLESDVVVSLCNGMTGYIRTSEGIFYIEPVEYINSTLNSFLHSIKMVPHTKKESNDILPSPMNDRHKCGTNGSEETTDNDISEEFPLALDLQNPIHNLVKRSTATNLSTNNESVHNRWKREEKEDYIMLEGDELSEGMESSQFFVKVLVVADRSMVDYYGHELHHYILTLMAQAARLYKHPSIGNAISVSVMEIKILKTQYFQSELAQGTLAKFCKWRKANTAHANHDVALLLTRLEWLEKATIGVARLGTMCSTESCAVAIDKGLPTTFTIAHEIGHTLNMPHDKDAKGPCINYNKGESDKYIMTDEMERDIKAWMWSPCSRNFATEFLRSKRAKCLLKHPTSNYLSTELADVPPGERYDVNKQCMYAFSRDSRACNLSDEVPCLQLWCTDDINSGCTTNHMQWADGTHCGNGKWCHNRECVPKRNDLKPIHGGWGSWSEWSQCSRSCGGGVKTTQRLCNDPIPENGGDYCIGNKIQYDSCNTQSCPDDKDFRAVQCSKNDGNNFNMSNVPRDVKWLPKYGLAKEEDQCKLYCRPQGSGSYQLINQKVVDGTKCGFKSFGICVDGKCRQGGCDNRLHSKLKLDDCGVCGGNSSECEEISGAYNITPTATGYKWIYTFPKGSSNLMIKQKDRANTKLVTYLALMDGETNLYILSGNNIYTPRKKEIPYGGTIISYSGSVKTIETIKTPKNDILSKPLKLAILTTNTINPPDITYRYIINKVNAPRYSWRLYQKEWPECSSICGGTKSISPICIDLGNDEQIVDDFYCANIDRHELVQKCNDHCRLTWHLTGKGECSAKCGPGNRTLQYSCLKIDNNERDKYMFYQTITAESISEKVDDSHCSMLQLPPPTEPCTGSCNARWLFGSWSQCSQSCGEGIQTRTAQCVDIQSNSPIDEENCYEKKVTRRECQNSDCPEWHTTEWSQCSVTCGRGFKTRGVDCKVGKEYYKEHFCNQYLKPMDTVECEMRECVQWSTAEWSACSATCGSGVQTREVFCESVDENRVMDLNYCSELTKPDATKICRMEKCPKPILPSNILYPYSHEDESNNNVIQIDFKEVEGRWIEGPWSQCSKTCEGGFMQRRIICRGAGGAHSCDQRKKPVSKTLCNTFRCPEWHQGGWSGCNENCERKRLFICKNHEGSLVPDSECNSKDKPNESTKCKLSQCPHLRNNDPAEYFNSSEDGSGRYRWKVGKWKECSAKCGNGFKTRNVTCHKVYPGGLVDPNPLPDLRYKKFRRNYCEMYNKPPDRMRCKESNCGDHFVWRTGPWRQCSRKCGREGRQIRQISCYNIRTGHKTAKKFCPREFRPRRKRKCNQWRCAHKSCADAKHNLKTKENKDYLLDLNGKLAVVYCYKMDTQKPEEYISLTSDWQNYAEVYHKRLVDLNTCPGKERDDNCDCVDVEPPRSGFTKFYKVRLDIRTMRIIEDDFTYAEKGRGKIAYGTAGDCYSKVEGCGQGMFSIDLTGTSFKLARDVNWIGNITDIRKTDQTVVGKCGGFCGYCNPDHSIGLHVEVT